MRTRLGSAKHSSLFTKSEVRNSSISHADLSNASRRSAGMTLIHKAKNSSRRILRCEKISAQPTARLEGKVSRMQFRSEETQSSGFEDAEQDSVLLELADLLSVAPAKLTKARMSHRTLVSKSTLKSGRSLARLRPIKPSILISPK